MHHLMGLVPPDQSALSLGRPLCVRRGSRGLQNQTGPLPHHAWAGRRETTGPRLARLGSGAREAHRVLGTNLGPTGGLVGAYPIMQCSLVLLGASSFKWQPFGPKRRAESNPKTVSPERHAFTVKLICTGCSFQLGQAVRVPVDGACC